MDDTAISRAVTTKEQSAQDTMDKAISSGAGCVQLDDLGTQAMFLVLAILLEDMRCRRQFCVEENPNKLPIDVSFPSKGC
jgi:hypothetical protein